MSNNNHHRSTSPASRPYRPVVLAILDGWGHAETGADPAHNALLSARTPRLDALSLRYPVSFLDASELHVGLPEGQMGNSEVGHMNIGSGRIVMQDLPRIDQAIASGALANHPELRAFIAALKASGGVCHLMGLLSPGGVHSHQRHLAALARLVAEAGVPVLVHLFTDGRDTPPRSAIEYLETFEKEIGQHLEVRIATVSGRYYAMDRDKRWDRVEKAYLALTQAGGVKAAHARQAITQSYAEEKGDEFILPTVLEGYAGMKDGDGVLMANFRADRAREILSSLLDPAFDGFARAAAPRFAAALGMVEYSTALNRFLTTLFLPEKLTDILGEVVARAGLKQLRIAETEKYAHVTFFFNGGREEPFTGEDRVLVPSPHVATYDLQPEMSAPEMTDKLVEAIRSGAYGLVVVNYANGDMVGHTGNVAAAIKAAETVDACLGRVADAVLHAGGALVISADHGNLEQMWDEGTKQPHTAHTLNRVPFTVIGNGLEKEHIRLENGRLCDIAPSVLALLGLPQPAAMTGRSLLAHVQP